MINDLVVVIKTVEATAELCYEQNELPRNKLRGIEYRSLYI